MLRNIQNRNSVFEIHAENSAVRIDAAHCLLPAEYHSLRKLAIGARCAKRTPGLFALSSGSGSGTRCIRSTQPTGDRMSQSGTQRRPLPRLAAELPASIWAALIIRRALNR